MAILFALGAVLGTALDQLHVASGTVSYAAPFAFGQAVWVPLLFGGAAVGFGDLHRRLRNLFHAEPAAETAALLRDFALFAAAYALTAYAPIPNAAVLGVLCAAWLLRAVLVRERPHRIAHALLCGACGVFAEWLLTGTGAFVHHRADVLRVPLWLPALYMLAAPLIGGLDDRLGAAQATPAQARAT